MKKEGGRTIFESVKRLLQQLATNDVLAHFNRFGSYGKQIFPLAIEAEIKGYSNIMFCKW